MKGMSSPLTRCFRLSSLLTLGVILLGGQSCYSQTLLQEPDSAQLQRRDPEPLNMNEVSQRMRYPNKARNKGIQGTVLVRVYFDSTGAYVKHRVLESPHELLTKAVVKHLHRLRVRPAEIDYRPVGSWITLPIRFKPYRDDSAESENA